MELHNCWQKQQQKMGIMNKQTKIYVYIFQSRWLLYVGLKINWVNHFFSMQLKAKENRTCALKSREIYMQFTQKWLEAINE